MSTGGPIAGTGSDDAPERHQIARPLAPKPNGAEPQPASDDALAELARLLAGACLRTAAWGLGTSLRVSGQLARVASDPELAGELYADAARGLRDYAREFLGMAELDERVRELSLLAGIPMQRTHGPRAELELRARGAALLRQAAALGPDDATHPAFARILTELAPDEARILRLLRTGGAQPMVDIRAGNLVGRGSQLIVGGLNMLGAEAGLSHRDRVPVYLDNLSRLGLVHRSEEPIGGPALYQVLEAQPDVLSTLKNTPRSKTVHRSLRLSAFGGEFCEVCVPLDAGQSASAQPSA